VRGCRSSGERGAIVAGPPHSAVGESAVPTLADRLTVRIDTNDHGVGFVHCVQAASAQSSQAEPPRTAQHVLLASDRFQARPRLYTQPLSAKMIQLQIRDAVQWFRRKWTTMFNPVGPVGERRAVDLTTELSVPIGECRSIPNPAAIHIDRISGKVVDALGRGRGTVPAHPPVVFLAQPPSGQFGIRGARIGGVASCYTGGLSRVARHVADGSTQGCTAANLEAAA